MASSPTTGNLWYLLVLAVEKKQPYVGAKHNSAMESTAVLNVITCTVLRYHTTLEHGDMANELHIKLWGLVQAKWFTTLMGTVQTTIPPTSWCSIQTLSTWHTTMQKGYPQYMLLIQNHLVVSEAIKQPESFRPKVA
jgi:hypothetical protein